MIYANTPPPPVLDEETILNILMGRIYKVRTGLGSDGWGPFLSKDEVEAYLTGACVVWYEGRWQGAWADNIRLVGLSP